MDQRIGSSSKPEKGEPVKGAGFDPAFIPGLTAPAEGGPEATSPAADAAPEREPQDVVTGAGEAGKAAPEPEPEAREAGDGPAFEASDRRARIVADRAGVRLSLDEEACEFRWPEIAAVETEVPRFGRRFTVTVHTPDRRWYPIEIEAGSRSDFTAWESDLDAVLDAYFEEA